MKKADRYFYIIISLVLVVFETVYIVKGEWSGDFWEHAAVVNELTGHLLHPRHPMLDLPSAHAFFSPYSLIVAVFSRITGLGPVMSLQCFAFFNLLLFVSSFYFFCRAIFRDNHNLVAGLSLIFILFFWGSSPFLWSGFYHIFVLNYVLPYPSTFAVALSFIVLGMLAGDKPGPGLKTVITITLTAVVFLSHPYTGLFLLIAVTAMVLVFYNASVKHIAFCFSLVLVVPILLCCAWPYYSFVELMTGSNAGFHEISKGLCERPAGIYWPVLLSLPAVLFLKKDKPLYFLLLAMAFMLLLAFAGYVSGSYGVLRIMSTVMLFAQVMIACAIVTIIKGNFKGAGKIYVAVVLFLFTAALIKNMPGLDKALNVAKPVDLTYYKRYEFLKTVVPADAVVLANLMSSWYIPVFSGKVLASVHPLFLVNDNNERQDNVNMFFNPRANDSLRETVILQYRPAYVLIDNKRDSLSASTMAWLKSKGNIVYEKDSLQLIILNSAAFGAIEKQE